MSEVSAKDYFLWEKKQLLKGGDKHSLSLLLELKGGISHNELTLKRLTLEGSLYLQENLDFIESIWENHLNNSVPIQYLCGFCFWRNLKLIVSEKVLIPRPETELIIEIVNKLFKEKSQKSLFAELGTGSGAISIAIALGHPLWEGIATDIDKNVLDVAELNFKNCSNQSNLKFFCGNWWNPLEPFKGKLDLVISNPPYIPKNTYENLPKEVKNFEPKVALLGGEDGLDHIREIIHLAPTYLKEKGWLIIENHFDQGEKVKQLLIENRFTSVEILKDFSGIGRFTIGRYK